MRICDFCRQFRNNKECGLGLNLPKGMGCREFEPGIEQFCSNPSDFVNAGQIIQMATYFGIKGTELKKVKQVAAQEGELRSKQAAEHTDSEHTDSLTAT